MPQTVLVTGGTGFVGGWCVVELLRRGYLVRATVRNANGEGIVRSTVAAGGQSADGLTFAHADLLADSGWAEAVAGADYVLHVASPLGSAQMQQDEMIAAARDGSLRVLSVAFAAGVKRVVMTSAAAVARAPRNTRVTSDETIWADPNDRKWDPYRLSKILAERAAWEFAEAHPGGTELTTILPGAVYGPLLYRQRTGGVQITQGLLRGRLSWLPRIGFWVVDVRDLAALHVDAMTSPEAAGQRFLATGDFMWMADMASTLRTQLGERAAKVPSRVAPDVLVRLLALFSPQLRFFTPELGRRNETTSAKARELLGFAPRPAAETIVDCADSLLGDA